MSEGRRDVDGGWAWVVFGASFFNLLLSSGFAIVSGIFQKLFLEQFGQSVAYTAWVTALFSSLMQLAGPLSSMLTSATNCRVTVMVGGVLLSGGLAASCFAPSLDVLLVTFGLTAGLGMGLLYTSSIVIVNFFFDRRRTIINGIVLSASGLGVSLAPLLSLFLIDHFSWREMMMILAAVAAHVCVCGAVMFPVHEAPYVCRRRCPGTPTNIKDVKDEHCDKDESRVFGVTTLPRITVENPEKFSPTSGGCNHSPGDSANPGHVANEDGGTINGTKNDVSHSPERTSLLEDETSALCLIHEKAKRTADSQSSNSRHLHSESIFHTQPLGSRTSLNDARPSSALFNSVLSLHSWGLPQVSQAPSERGGGGEGGCGGGGFLVVLRSVPFLLLCLQLMLYNMAASIGNIHLPAFCAQKGLDNAATTMSLALLGVGVFLSRILVGVLGSEPAVDKLVVYFGLHLLGALMEGSYPWTSDAAGIAVVSFLLGLTSCGNYTLLASLNIAILDLDSLPCAFGLEMVVAGVGYLIAAPLAGWVVDETQDYNYSMYLGGFVMFLSAVTVLFIPLCRAPGSPPIGYNPPPPDTDAEIQLRVDDDDHNYNNNDDDDGDDDDGT